MPEIAVLVKRVPDTNARIVISDGRVDLSAVKWVMSPYDEYALESAMMHKEAKGGSVVAVTLGAADCDKVLKDAKAIGVDRIVRIWDDSWSELDSNQVQSAIASAIETLGSEVVYCGKSAADTGAASTGPGVAERLGWASASNIAGLSFEDAGVEVLIPDLKGNARTGVSLPAVISCDKGFCKPRRANVKGIMIAKRSQVEILSVEIPPSSINIVSHTPPPEKAPGQKFEGAENVPAVVLALRNDAKVI
jgi:electron transfer flavoprotein beta subunit